MEWKDPPPAIRVSRRYDWASVAAALRAKPGQWALIRASTTGSYAARIRGGHYADFRPAGSFEATTRTVGRDVDGRALFDTYARYVGDD